MPMTNRPFLSNSSRLFSTVVIASGAALLVLRAPALRFNEPWLFLLILIAAIALSASKVHLPFAGKATLSMSYFTDFLAIIMLGPDEGMLIAGTGGLMQCLIMSRGRPSVRRTLFSVAALLVSTQAAGLLAAVLGGFPRHASVVSLTGVTLASSATFFIVNSGLVATAVAFSSGETLRKTWYDNFLWAAPACLIAASLAMILTRASNAFVWAPLLAAGPLFVTFKAYRIYLGRVEDQQRHVKEVSDLYLATVEALARAIDARDQTIDHRRVGDNHIRRVQAAATALAEAAGMRPEEIEAVKVAALLHDIGKLAVPEHILSKPSRLSPKEFARVRIHPIVGAEIIKAVPFPYPVSPLIRSHHERWDGSGYPDGLRGAETPLGARVLAVVDYYDALSSTRPYHGPADRHECIATLIAEAGRALDPSLVELFLRILPTLDKGPSIAQPATEGKSSARDRDASPSNGAEERSRSTPSWVFHNISLATQEMRALHDIAQTLGTRLSVDDTMALLTSKLNRLIPGSCWVLFLHDRTEDVLRCRYATGLSPDLTARLTIPVGEGPSGWAARQRTAVLNARAEADFEAANVGASGHLFQSALSYPLVDGDELIGTLTVYHAERDMFREEHRHVLDHISGQAASVLRNAVAFEMMRDVSFRDALTELPNSRALSEFLRRRLAEASTDRGPISLVMIDLDDFKAVNDGHGHQQGDAALRAVARVIRSHVRGSDFCARYGGDEFVAVLSGCDRAEAEQRARDLQDEVSRIRLESGRDAPVTLGISVGVSVFPEDGDNIDALITSADRRMYLNKSSRRAIGEISTYSASS